MAKNEVYTPGRRIPLTVTAPATPASGDPVICGNIPGVAIAAVNADGVTAVQCEGVFNLAVKAHNGTTGTAVAAGDIVYYDTGANGPVNVNSSGGKRFGYALAAVTSGATTTIPVKLGY